MTLSRGFTRIAKTTRLLLLATVLPATWLSGCQIGWRGEQFTIGPRLRAAPTVGQKIGQVTIDGRTFCLYDTGDDGVPDFVYDPTTGRWYPIVAAPPATPFMPSPEALDAQTAWIGVLPTPNGAASSDPQMLPIGQWDWVADAVDLDSGIAGSEPFDFGGLSAEQWIEAVGLDVEPETVVEIDQVVDLHLFDTETWYTDIQVPLSTEFHMPDVLEYDVDYEIYGIPSDSGGPTFHVIRLAGEVTEIISFLVEMGGMELTGQHLESTWTVIADESTLIADLYQDGELIMSVPF